jgi:polyhydroxybutyrate depolymerase
MHTETRSIPRVLGWLAVAACGSNANGSHEAPGDAGASPQRDSSAEASACATGSYEGGVPPGPWGPGDYPPGITAQTWLPITGVQGQQGLTRQYKVHVPSGYSAGVAAPLLFCFHGLGQDGVAFCTDDGVGWNTQADLKGFILVIPNGYQQSWNGGSCCGAAASMVLDDVSLVRAIFAEVARHVNVDPKRVYATGYSTGAYMSYRLACEASDLVVAVAPSAGEIGIPSIGGGTGGGGGAADAGADFATCAPSQPVSVLDIHGTSDTLISYSLQPKTLALAAMIDGCSATTMSSSPAPPSGGDTTCVTYSGCPGGIEVSACAVQGGGHCWFGSPDCGTGAAEVVCTGGGTFGGLLGGGGLGGLGGLLGDGGINGVVSSIVGKNSNFMKNTDRAWEFFARHSR